MGWRPWRKVPTEENRSLAISTNKVKKFGNLGKPSPMLLKFQ